MVSWTAMLRQGWGKHDPWTLSTPSGTRLQQDTGTPIIALCRTSIALLTHCGFEGVAFSCSNSAQQKTRRTVGFSFAS